MEHAMESYDERLRAASEWCKDKELKELNHRIRVFLKYEYKLMEEQICYFGNLVDLRTRCEYICLKQRILVLAREASSLRDTFSEEYASWRQIMEDVERLDGLLEEKTVKRYEEKRKKQQLYKNGIETKGKKMEGFEQKYSDMRETIRQLEGVFMENFSVRREKKTEGLKVSVTVFAITYFLGTIAAACFSRS